MSIYTDRHCHDNLTVDRLERRRNEKIGHGPGSDLLFRKHFLKPEPQGDPLASEKIYIFPPADQAKGEFTASRMVSYNKVSRKRDQNRRSDVIRFACERIDLLGPAYRALSCASRLSALGACEPETSIFVTDDATRNERDRCVVSSIRITILDFATIVCMEALPPSASKRSHQCAMRPVIMTLWLRLQVLYCGGIHISRDERTNLIQQGKRGEWP